MALRRTFGLLFILRMVGVLTADEAPPAFQFAIRQAVEADFDIDGQRHAYRETRYRFDFFAVERGGGRLNASVGYAHLYRVFDFPERDEALSPATNGHLHATGPVFRFAAGSSEITLHPLLAVSSNVLRETRDFEFRDLQLHGKIIRRTSAPAAGDRDGYWEWGLQSDSRTGRWVLLPVLNWNSSPEPPLQLSLGFPDSAILWTPVPEWTLSVDFGPAGGEWRVRDADFTQTSTFRQRRWTVTGTLARELGQNLTLSLGIEQAFAQRWEYTLETGERQSRSPPDASQIFAGIQVRF